MINSILNRHKDPVKFNNIKTPNDIVTDPKLIKEHIKHHFDNWTAYRPINDHEFNTNWLEEYKPKATTSSDHYNSALGEFSLDEITRTLNQLLTTKHVDYLESAMKCLNRLVPLFFKQ